MTDSLQRAVNTDALTRAGMVPFITAWSGERPTRTLLIARGRTGIAYKRERAGDRDAKGVLWERYVSDPGAGTPQFSKVHPRRQRQAMRHLLCQVCGGLADQDERGILWLVGEAEKQWPGAETTGQPPVCLRCAGLASRACPHLRRRTLALRVRHAPIVGAKGIFYHHRHGRLLNAGPATLLYSDPRICWLGAHQLLRELHDCTVVDLTQELALSH